MLSDDEFRTLLERLDRPWAGFRKVRKGVKKRLRRQMQAMGCSNVEQYICELNHQPDAMAACQDFLRVTISRFFRDGLLWRTLRKEILPDLVKRFPAPIRIWSAGCACGEEPYTLAMVWSEMEFPDEMELLATDAGEACLDRARSGRYPASSLKEVPAGMKEKYFEEKKGGRQMQIGFGPHRIMPDSGENDKASFQYLTGNENLACFMESSIHLKEPRIWN